MKVIDLHGVLHKDVERVLDRACTELQAPFFVVTGHSRRMKELVSLIVSARGFKTRLAVGNAGRLVVYEGR